MANLSAFTRAQIEKARSAVHNDGFETREELESELGEEQAAQLFEAVENEPIARNEAWTAEQLAQARRLRKLRPLTAPSCPRAPEAAKELQNLWRKLDTALGGAWEIEKWCEQQEPLRAKLGEPLADFYELMTAKEWTVWDLCAATKLSQPSVWRRLKTLENQGLIQELAPLPTRWAVIRE